MWGVHFSLQLFSALSLHFSNLTLNLFLCLDTEKMSQVISLVSSADKECNKQRDRLCSHVHNTTSRDISASSIQ